MGDFSQFRECWNRTQESVRKITKTRNNEDQPYFKGDIFRAVLSADNNDYPCWIGTKQNGSGGLLMILREGQSLPNTLFRNFANPIECDNGELTMYFFCNNMNMGNEGYGEARAYFGGNNQKDHGFTITLVGEMVVLGNVAPQQIASVLAGHHNMAI